MINFNAIPDDVKQFMVDKLCSNCTRNIIVCIISVIILLIISAYWVSLITKKEKGKKSNIVFLIITIAVIIAKLLTLFHNICKMNNFRKDPEMSVLEYIDIAYTNNDYYAELCKRGIDIYQMN